MKTKKIVLDIIMTILIVSLMDVVFTGIKLHEILGIGVFILFIVHKVFNWNWIKSVTKNLFNVKISAKTKVMYIIDVLLLILLTFIIISGILISQELFTSLNAENTTLWSDLHHFASYCALILISIHIGVHWEMIMRAFRKMFRIKQNSKMRTIILRVLVITIAILGIKSIIKPGIVKNFTAPFKTDHNEEKFLGNNHTIKQNYESTVITDNTNSLVSTVSLEQYNKLKVNNEKTHKQGGKKYKNRKESKVDDMIFIMGLFIGATYYTVTIPKQIKKKVSK